MYELFLVGKTKDFNIKLLISNYGSGYFYVLFTCYIFIYISFNVFCVSVLLNSIESSYSAVTAILPLQSILQYRESSGYDNPNLCYFKVMNAPHKNIKNNIKHHSVLRHLHRKRCKLVSSMQQMNMLCCGCVAKF